MGKFMTVFYFAFAFSEVFSVISQECQVTTTTLKPCGEVFVENSQISRGKKGPRGCYFIHFVKKNFQIFPMCLSLDSNAKSYVK